MSFESEGLGLKRAQRPRGRMHVQRLTDGFVVNAEGSASVLASVYWYTWDPFSVGEGAGSPFYWVEAKPLPGGPGLVDSAVVCALTLTKHPHLLYL